MSKKKTIFTHSSLLFGASKTAAFAGACVLLTLAGCSGSKSAPESSVLPPKTTVKSADTLDREDWELCFVQGIRVGYVQTAYYRTLEAGKPALRIEGDMHVAINRNGEEIKQQFRSTSIETPEGRLLRFKSEMQMGTAPLLITGLVVGNRLHMETDIAGQKSTKRYRLVAGIWGFFRRGAIASPQTYAARRRTYFAYPDRRIQPVGHFRDGRPR